jgi:hypothetical protein
VVRGDSFDGEFEVEIEVAFVFLSCAFSLSANRWLRCCTEDLQTCRLAECGILFSKGTARCNSEMRGWQKVEQAGPEHLGGLRIFDL